MISITSIFRTLYHLGNDESLFVFNNGYTCSFLNAIIARFAFKVKFNNYPCIQLKTHRRICHLYLKLSKQKAWIIAFMPRSIWSMKKISFTQSLLQSKNMLARSDPQELVPRTRAWVPRVAWSKMNLPLVTRNRRRRNPVMVRFSPDTKLLDIVAMM